MNVKAICLALLLVPSGAWPGVVVLEQKNQLKEGNFSSGRIGGPPPKPWQCSKSSDKIRVTLETPAGQSENERWVRLVDDGDKENANVRQSFSPVASGRFQARLISNKAGGRLFFNLGSGSASKPEERAVQLTIDTDGSLGARGERAKTSLQIKAGEVYLIRCDFEPVRDGKSLHIVAELVEESSQRQSRIETETETNMTITAIRVTSTGPETGVDYSLTDLSLVAR